ncbi:MAG TPA: VWA domain-containing protein [Candidatus Sulfotelmatobacter sp.]|nr:VWA domain-containing protein [Candidatus Sulfotelmatobacter sp.]
MAPVKINISWRKSFGNTLTTLAMALALVSPALQAQSSGSQTQPPASTQPAQDIPDAPSTVQPPPKTSLPPAPPPGERKNEPIPFPGDTPQPADQNQPDQGTTAPHPMPPVETVPPGSTPRMPRNQIDGLLTFKITTNFVQIPVMVKTPDGRRVDGLLPKDFTVLENGKKQTLTYFTSDPFELSVAIVLDTGMADVALQKINETYSALAGAFSPYDEVALYTYSSTVSQATDFTSRPERLTAALNEMKEVRGHANGPPVLGGPLGQQGPTVNGAPAGGPIIAPVNTPPRESHVLNDALLRAALDLSKREKTRRKVIFVISDGRELGSQASYKGVLHLLQTRDIQVRAVLIDSGALPGYKQLERFHLPDQGRDNLLTKYAKATCGAEPLAELSRNAIEDAYAEITSEARNQYTLGYSPQAVTGSSAYRSVEVQVDKKGLKVTAKDGYYAIPQAR